MNKLIVPEEEIRNFSIDRIKDFEGCPAALRFLKAKFGDKVDDLTLYGGTIKLLIQNDKADWAINFMLNLLKPQYRLSFYLIQLNQALDKMEDNEIKEFASNAFQTYSKRCSKKNYESLSSKMDMLLSNIQSEIENQTDEEKKDKLHHELLVLQSINFFLQDQDKKFTRHITDALLKLAEAKVYTNLVQYPYEDNIQDIGFTLMEYVNIW